ncbi:hypothetical protein P3T20_003991 [Paraburkholderia sp. GAS206C]
MFGRFMPTEGKICCPTPFGEIRGGLGKTLIIKKFVLFSSNSSGSDFPYKIRIRNLVGVLHDENKHSDENGARQTCAAP